MRARESVHAISGTPAGMFRHPVEQLLGELCSELAYARVDDIIAAGLHEYLDRLQTQDEPGRQRNFRDVLRRPGHAARPQEGEGTNCRHARSSCEGTWVAPSRMAIHVALHHRTSYRYDRPVTLSPHVVRLRPAPHCRTPILSYSLKVEPQRALPQLAAGPAQQLPGAARVSREDASSCWSTSISSPRCRSSIPFDFFLEPSAEKFPFAYEPWLQPGAGAVPRAAAGRAEAPRAASTRSIGGRVRTIDFLVDLNRRLSQDIALRHPPGAGRADARGDARHSAAARAATPAGCSCRSCGTSASRRASSPAT